MDPDPLALAMKLATFAGVATACAGLLRAAGEDARRRCLALGAGGVALMFANALIAPDPLALLVDLAYALLAAATAHAALRPTPAPTPEPAERTPTPQPATRPLVILWPTPAPAPAPEPAERTPTARPAARSLVMLRPTRAANPPRRR